MNKHLRNYAASAMLALPAAVSLVAWPGAAMAQPATPEVRSLQIAADGGLDAGSTLSFTLIGTPRAEANVRIRGLRESIPLRETDRGVYVGRYTIRRSDRIDTDAQVRATLQDGNRRASENYVLAEAMPRPRVVAPPPMRLPEPRIERFGMAPVDRVGPGVELRFALEGVAGGSAVVDLPGVDRNVALSEVRPGHYEGAYTLRRGDDLNPNRPIVATLAVGNRVATSSMALPMARPGADNRPPAGDNRPPTLGNLSPREGATVPAGQPVQIGASFDDGRGSGIDPATVQIAVAGRNVTRDAQINRQSFSFRAALPPGRHTVDVSARDQAGNVLRRSWTFDVAAAVVAVPVPVPLAAQVINHYPNTEIGPDPILVKGRTAPNAVVAVTVRAIPPLPPAPGLARIVFSQTLQADHEGVFSFTMVPGMPFPGEHYEFVMVARHGNLSQESRFTLIQRPG